MEECYICYSKIQSSEFKTLSCNHKMCNSCYLHLNNNFCPYCRQPFTYSKDDTIKRQRLNLTYINNNTSPQLFNERPTFINNYNDFEINNQIRESHISNSRLIRNKNRKRRRNLSFEEIQQRRINIRRKCKKKWQMKEGRLNKLKWYEI